MVIFIISAEETIRIANPRSGNQASLWHYTVAHKFSSFWART